MVRWKNLMLWPYDARRLFPFRATNKNNLLACELPYETLRIANEAENSFVSVIPK